MGKPVVGKIIVAHAENIRFQSLPAEKMKFSKQLYDHRTDAELTQEEAAEATGYSRSAIQKFESGRRTPPLRAREPMLRAISKRARMPEPDAMQIAKEHRIQQEINEI